MNWYYEIYGLRVCSNIPVPGLRSAPQGPSDTFIHLGELPPGLGFAGVLVYESANLDQTGIPILTVHKHAGGFFLFQYCDGTRFVVEPCGGRIWADWPTPLTVDDAATYLVGPVLGLILRLRGFVCLHASAIRVKEHAVAFAGGNGAGKSTLAAKFAQLGYNVLSDDLVPLRQAGDRILAEPGYPRLRLWSDSAGELFGPEADLPRLTPNWDKRYLELSGMHESTALPLETVYLLGQPDDLGPRLEEVSLTDAYCALIATTYCNYLLDRSLRAFEFDLLATLLQRVPVRKIVPARGPGAAEKLSALLTATW